MRKTRAIDRAIAAASLEPMADMTALLVPHGTQWAIEPRAGEQLWKMLQNTTVSAHLQDAEARSGRSDGDARDYDVIDGVAVISMVGPMTKARTSFGTGASTVEVRRMVRSAAMDPEVKGIMLRIDSPGGSVSGTEDLARDVAAANRKKPCATYFEDTGCSAAYWVGCQAASVWANRTAMVGSIGTYAVLYDSSGYAESVGVKVHVLSTGQYKGAGVDGAPVTDEQLAEFQRTVDSLNEHFLSAVARGRKMGLAQVRQIADGRVHVARSQNGGSDALSLGLIDAVGSFDQAMADLRKTASSTAAKASNEDMFEAEGTTISDEDGPPAGLMLAEESALALAAVNGLTGRLKDLKEDRAADGRKLSEKARGHVSQTLEGIEAAREECLALLAEEPESTTTEDPSVRDALRIALDRANLRAALA
jgi:signal peptide peptidase SppA